MKSILITGGAGFIGSHTCLVLLERGYRVFVIDSFQNSSPESLRRVVQIGKLNNQYFSDELHIFNGDLRDKKFIKETSYFLNSNGYSIVNYLAERLKLGYYSHPELLTPTTIYAPVVKRILNEGDCVYGMAHITGGGIPENLPRCLPEGVKAHIDWNSWSVPEIFSEIQHQGNMDDLEMRKVFNLGIGYCVIVPANRTELTMNTIKNEGIDCWEIGEIYEDVC